MEEFKVFKQLAETASTNEKVAILKANDSERLRNLLRLTYDKFLTYRIKQIDMPEAFNRFQPDVYDQLTELLERLASHTVGTNDAKKQIYSLLKKCTPSGALWVSRIITRDLSAGVNESLINTAFPFLIPVFDVQLAYPIYKKGKNPKNYWPTLKYPVIVEEKLDGVRGVAVCKDNKVTFFSREGHEYNECGVFAEQVRKLRPGTDFVLDGEIIAKRFNPDNKTAIKHKDSNRWPFQQALSMIKDEETTKEEVAEYLGFYVWDIIELDYFESQGKSGKKLDLTSRKLSLTSLFERQDKPFENLYLVPNGMAKNEEEVKTMFKIVRSKGGEIREAVNKKGKVITYKVPDGEGVMVKRCERGYEFKRTDAVLKAKEFYTCDLRIIGAYEGEPDSKYVGMLGGVNLESDCGTIKTKCGSFQGSETNRADWWVEHLSGRLIGLIMETSYQEITAEGSLNFPVGIQIRRDKNTTSVE